MDRMGNGLFFIMVIFVGFLGLYPGKSYDKKKRYAWWGEGVWRDMIKACSKGYSKISKTQRARERVLQHVLFGQNSSSTTHPEKIQTSNQLFPIPQKKQLQALLAQIPDQWMPKTNTMNVHWFHSPKMEYLNDTYNKSQKQQQQQQQQQLQNHWRKSTKKNMQSFVTTTFTGPSCCQHDPPSPHDAKMVQVLRSSKHDWSPRCSVDFFGGRICG